MDFELLLYDRLEVIRKTIEKYGEDYFYISFSGGKDSTVVHYLVDMALPNNHISRVFSNTGIEYLEIVDFVKSMAENDNRFVLIKPSQNIKNTLEEFGYPFKSKQYSNWVKVYQAHKEKIDVYFNMIKDNPDLINDYNFIHNLPEHVKPIIKMYYAIIEKDGELTTTRNGMPKCLRYQFNSDFNLKISDLCCTKMKEEPLEKWAKENKKKGRITGLMKEEGGRRIHANCITVKGKHVTFSPLAVMSKEWEEWFIEKYNLKICKLYQEPFNFVRTGCKGCPFILDLQQELDTLDKLLPIERKQCEYIWEPVYKEYRRTNYRLNKDYNDE